MRPRRQGARALLLAACASLVPPGCAFLEGGEGDDAARKAETGPVPPWVAAAEGRGNTGEERTDERDRTADEDTTEETAAPADTDGPDDPDARARAIAARLDAVRRGEELYPYTCAPCHGRRGDGRGRDAAALATPPTDFRAGYFVERRTAREVFEAITHGVPRTGMPAWGRLLSPRLRWDLTAYVRSLGRPAPE